MQNSVIYEAVNSVIYEAVNRYIHGGDGTVKDAVSAIGFAIYQTEEILCFGCSSDRSDRRLEKD